MHEWQNLAGLGDVATFGSAELAEKRFADPTFANEFYQAADAFREGKFFDRAAALTVTAFGLYDSYGFCSVKKDELGSAQPDDLDQSIKNYLKKIVLLDDELKALVFHCDMANEYSADLEAAIYALENNIPIGMAVNDLFQGEYFNERISELPKKPQTLESAESRVIEAIDQEPDYHPHSLKRAAFLKYMMTTYFPKQMAARRFDFELPPFRSSEHKTTLNDLKTELRR